MKNIAIIGTLDTKGQELQYLRQSIVRQGYQCTMIDCGVRQGAVPVEAEFSHEAVAEAAGTSISELLAKNDVANALDAMGRGAARIVSQLYHRGEIDGVISIGGGQGTYLGMTAMSALPFGFPKVMVSTLARAVKELFTDAGDTVVLDPIVDIAGLNRMLCRSLDSAARIITALTKAVARTEPIEHPVIAITMFGVTTRCVDMVRGRLERAGYEVWVFHSNGIGGMNMEKLIRCGYIQGVVDLTTSEVSQTVLGGTAATIATRMEAAGDMGIPQVVSVGGMDHVNFLAPETVPERYRNDPQRRFHMHNPSTTIMRSAACDYEEIGRIFAEKLNRAMGSVQVVLPARGISEYDRDGGVWFDPLADRVLFQAIETHLNRNIPVTELDCHINDPLFAETVSEKMLEAMAGELQEAQ